MGMNIPRATMRESGMSVQWKRYPRGPIGLGREEEEGDRLPGSGSRLDIFGYMEEGLAQLEQPMVVMCGGEVLVVWMLR